ncbi:MAG: hypothetical protein ACPGUV_13295 [Polyangiales bacterium]
MQLQLQQIYDVTSDVDVVDFLCDADFAAALVGDAVEREELLLVHSDAEGTAVALYLHAAVLDEAPSLPHPELPPPRFAAACLATEGVSHFLYLHFRAQHDHRLRELELELQAEVDKYAAPLLAGWGVGLVQAKNRTQSRRATKHRSQKLRQRLFADVRFRDAEDSPPGARYRLAHRLAARYAALLESHYVTRADQRGLLRELRRFYRLGQEGKLRRVRELGARAAPLPGW